MSDMDENTDKLAELTNKLNRCNKNIKTIMETLKTIEGKLTEPKKEEKKEDKERIDKIFEKRKMGRPVGSWDDKRKQYLEWINTGKITQPKDQTLMYYKINMMRRLTNTNIGTSPSLIIQGEKAYCHIKIYKGLI